MPLDREALDKLLGSACYRNERIRRELGPCSVQVLGGVGALESALEATGAVQPAEGALPELLVVVERDQRPVALARRLAEALWQASMTALEPFLAR